MTSGQTERGAGTGVGTGDSRRGQGTGESWLAGPASLAGLMEGEGRQSAVAGGAGRGARVRRVERVLVRLVLPAHHGQTRVRLGARDLGNVLQDRVDPVLHLRRVRGRRVRRESDTEYRESGDGSRQQKVAAQSTLTNAWG